MPTGLTDTVARFLPVLRAEAKLRCGDTGQADALVEIVLMRAIEDVGSFKSRMYVEQWLLDFLDAVWLECGHQHQRSN